MSVHTQDCHVPGIVFSGFCVIWISLSEGDQDKTNTPSSLFLSSMNLDVGEALVNKDAESHRGIVWLRLIRPKQTTGKFWNVCRNKELELRGRRKGRGEPRFQNTLEDLKLRVLERNLLCLGSGIISNFQGF